MSLKCRLEALEQPQKPARGEPSPLVLEVKRRILALAHEKRRLVLDKLRERLREP